MWPTQADGFGRSLFERIESSGSQATVGEAAVHSARLWLCLFGQPARIIAAPALAATSSPVSPSVSQSAKTKKKTMDCRQS